jgi:hypothetical protein
VLTGPGGEFLADHEVRLDTRCWQFEAFTGLAGYLRWRVSPVRRLAHEAEIVAGVGAWIGEQVLGPVGAAMAAAWPATVRVIVPADPPEAAHLMFVPLELGHSGGRDRALSRRARRPPPRPSRQPARHGLTMTTETPPEGHSASGGYLK